ncbi:MurR/RpiR family transcriptional regulator [Aquibacillus koreensis]|uniref:MurR/RpiR family transcriptional regulator n=1 Tax=Aquibacillus koreensis TaxID=279446 RepID=A0A9X3WIW6_9BACI|nr:MurR/RpiR family transcriptional regulator [Aquibacillus koreensis]MCT2536494.1 MurR/RpiR family transcriptional regulator [Aquibacillus koreensis]MDC3419418.1 MurR/RpiR family transcriptional regulator [Aquibacillus koreensis]
MTPKGMQQCLMRIRSYYPTFSEKEKKIADYILEKPENIVHGTINQVADDLGVADSTVFRFCKRLGFKGYQAMKIILATELVEPMQDIHERILGTDNEITVVEKVFHSNMKTLEDTLKVLDEQDFASTIQAILQARKVEFFGIGGSNVIALDAYHKLIRTGLPVFAQTDTHMQHMSASQMTDQDVAVLISHTGATKDILNILEIAKENGVKTIAITSFARSQLSQAVDISLHTVSEETDFRSEALASRIAQLSIIDAIYVNVMMARKEEGKESLRKVRQAISLKRL